MSIPRGHSVPAKEEPANPEGLPIEVFDGIRAGVLADRSQFFNGLTIPFYGVNREGSEVSVPTLFLHLQMRSEV